IGDTPKPEQLASSREGFVATLDRGLAANLGKRYSRGLEQAAVLHQQMMQAASAGTPAGQSPHGLATYDPFSEAFQRLRQHLLELQNQVIERVSEAEQQAAEAAHAVQQARQRQADAGDELQRLATSEPASRLLPLHQAWQQARQEREQAEHDLLALRERMQACAERERLALWQASRYAAHGCAQRQAALTQLQQQYAEVQAWLGERSQHARLGELLSGWDERFTQRSRGEQGVQAAQARLSESATQLAALQRQREAQGARLTTLQQQLEQARAAEAQQQASVQDLLGAAGEAGLWQEVQGQQARSRVFDRLQQLAQRREALGGQLAGLPPRLAELQRLQTDKNAEIGALRERYKALK
ncbi:KinB sensor domain-containing domain, partial [Bowmanella yangjiangensis]|nr:hypothetical protein [Bowmanella yangjiangensis]